MNKIKEDLARARHVNACLFAKVSMLSAQAEAARLWQDAARKLLALHVHRASCAGDADMATLLDGRAMEEMKPDDFLPLAFAAWRAADRVE